MRAVTWALCVTIVMCTQSLMTSCSAYQHKNCHAQCLNDETKWKCLNEQDCRSKLPDHRAMTSCLHECSKPNTDCLDKCLFDTDAITKTCNQQCSLEGSSGDKGQRSEGSSGDGGQRAERTTRDTSCFDNCYKTTLDKARSAIFTELPQGFQMTF